MGLLHQRDAANPSRSLDVSTELVLCHWRTEHVSMTINTYYCDGHKLLIFVTGSWRDNNIKLLVSMIYFTEINFNIKLNTKSVVTPWITNC